MKEETIHNEETLKKDRKDKDKADKKVRKRKKKDTSTIVLIVILLAGVGVMLYPTVSNWWNSMHATQAIASYVDIVDSMSAEEKETLLKEAREYNEKLPEGVHFTLTEDEKEAYEKILDISGTGIMGYVQISSIGVNLPIYHGMDEGILQIAAGHIPGSSFPVGGEGTHSVLTGHRALPSARLFTDLDQLSEGDVFTVTVLDQTIAYMIDQIRIVVPEETEELAIEDGKDYCTLVTCTPYGVNTHRMLIRGHRTSSADPAAVSEAVRIPSYIVVLAVGIPILFLILAGMLFYYRRRGPRSSGDELLDNIKSDKN